MDGMWGIRAWLFRLQHARKCYGWCDHSVRYTCTTVVSSSPRPMILFIITTTVAYYDTRTRTSDGLTYNCTVDCFRALCNDFGTRSIGGIATPKARPDRIKRRARRRNLLRRCSSSRRTQCRRACRFSHVLCRRLASPDRIPSLEAVKLLHSGHDGRSSQLPDLGRRAKLSPTRLVIVAVRQTHHRDVPCWMTTITGDLWDALYDGAI